jgi:hypothetical protein
MILTAGMHEHTYWGFAFNYIHSKWPRGGPAQMERVRAYLDATCISYQHTCYGQVTDVVKAQLPGTLVLYVHSRADNALDYEISFLQFIK